MGVVGSELANQSLCLVTRNVSGVSCVSTIFAFMLRSVRGGVAEACVIIFNATVRPDTRAAASPPRTKQVPCELCPGV